MYLIQTPGGVSLQWYHSTGIMVLQYLTTYNASVPTRGLCGESAPLRTCSCHMIGVDYTGAELIYASAC